MIKILAVFFFLVSTGGCVMDGTVNSQSLENGQTAGTQKGIEEKILEHARANFSLNAADLTLKEITSSDLPAGVKLYYAEKKGSYGNQHYNYLVFDGKLFCSKIDGDFERFLKDSNFLSKKNLTAAQFENVFQQLKFNYGEAIIVDERLIAKPYDFMEPFAAQLAAPTLNFQNNAATFTFFAADSNDEIVRKYTVNIAQDYRTSIEHSNLKAK